MKRNMSFSKAVFTLLVACLPVLGVYAEYTTSLTNRAWQQNRQTYNKPINYVGLGLKAGYSQFNLGKTDLNVPGGAHFGLEARYKMEYRLFRLTAGIDAVYAGNSMNGKFTKDYDLLQPDLCHYHLDFTRLNEKQHTFEVGIPIMVGADYRGFYGMVGMRIGLPLMKSYALNTEFNRIITDDKGIDPYTDMLNHDLYSDNMAQNGKLDLKMLNPQVAVEIGYNLDRWLASKAPVPDPVKQTGKQKPKTNVPFTQLLHYEVAMYANIGVSEFRNQMPAQGASFYDQSGVNITDVRSLTTDAQLASGKMLPWNVGVRFNVYYELYDTPVIKEKKKRKKKKKPQPVIEQVVDTIVPEVPMDTIVYNGDTIYSGDTIIMDNLYFDTDKTTIRHTSDEALNELAELLAKHPNANITLIGHTDNVGTEAYNQRLSQGRVESVKAELVKRGINGDRIKTIGKGESEPIADNSTAQGRAENRRVEVVFDEIIIEQHMEIIPAAGSNPQAGTPPQP